jgi:hypothetical protein
VSLANYQNWANLNALSSVCLCVGNNQRLADVAAKSKRRAMSVERLLTACGQTTTMMMIIIIC